MDDKRKGQTTQSGNSETSRNDEKLGQQSQMGSTSADFEKRKIQTVETNELDTDAREANSVRERQRDMKERQGEPERANYFEDILDQGAVRTAAFSEGNEPRSEESLENRGKTLGSDDDPMRKTAASEERTRKNEDRSQPSHGGEQNPRSMGTPEE